MSSWESNVDLDYIDRVQENGIVFLPPEEIGNPQSLERESGETLRRPADDFGSQKSGPGDQL